MSEPRKLYTAGATGSSEQEQYEAARRRAQQRWPNRTPAATRCSQQRIGPRAAIS